MLLCAGSLEVLSGQADKPGLALKLADYGLHHFTEGGLALPYPLAQATPGYCAPEVLAAGPPAGRHGPESVGGVPEGMAHKAVAARSAGLASKDAGTRQPLRGNHDSAATTRTAFNPRL